MPYTVHLPVNRQARFTMIALFRESVEFTRDYTLPFNLLSICVRSEGENASIIRNLKTNEEYSSRVGEIILRPCNLPQRYHHTLRNEHIAIHFKLELFPGVDVYSGQGHIYRENSPALMRKALEIFETPDPVLSLSRGQEFALHFCHSHWPEYYGFEVKEMQKFCDVLWFIREEANAATLVTDLAKILGMSESSFFRKFYEVFNISPKQFLQKEIFNKAAQLLLMPGASVKNVAEKLNFSTEFYFSHFFKRHSGVSPQKYKETHSLLIQ